ncbi:hypothetical protein HYH03_017585 [Edaphochlamys debaryana]|uniref:Aminotransferase class I/classII large domain-containing protein n=1 Tax=Edaphochlamys debaryana TaxID=47281 RepID=A0A835XIT6_9CHLO|nr:hypothetical protein HYH03_017585 [Edaphochlamys debaryana]|eukprot:KAG2483578.1 hypothetical protein HYH03_017585 [Edaphochlamys debaryana]
MSEEHELLPGRLSKRAARAVRPSLSYFKAFLDAQKRQWSPEDPEGNIILSVAENRLTSDLVQERLSASAADFPQDALCYQNMRGITELRSALARLLEATFMKGIPVDPEHLAVSAGAGAVLDNVFHCIAGPGDAVLIPAPYYPAFDNDLEVKAAVQPVPFWLDEDRPIGPQLDAAAETAANYQLSTAATANVSANGNGHAAAADGAPPRRRRVCGLLIATPNNPLGIVYKRETVLGMLRWCLSHEVHLISDEIYGNSVWGEAAPPFVSTEVLARQEAAALPHADRLTDLLHVVWGLSKDFCGSGLRVGCLHTRNTQLLTAFDNLGYFCAVPNTLQWSLARALSDEAWVASFIAENTRRMRAAYAGLEAALVSAGIPHVKADSAMFCWIDLRHWLTEPTWEGEAALWERMCKEAHVLLTPGQQCHGPEPGFFRVCWAWVPAPALPVAVGRLAERFGEGKGKGKGEGPEEEQG